MQNALICIKAFDPPNHTMYKKNQWFSSSRKLSGREEKTRVLDGLDDLYGSSDYDLYSSSNSDLAVLKFFVTLPKLINCSGVEERNKDLCAPI